MTLDPKDIEQFVDIDPFQLDKECVSLPSDYLKFSTTSALLRKQMDEAKARLDVESAALSKRIRSNPEKYGLDKVTESAVTGMVLLDQSYQKADRAYRRARYEYDISQSAVWAMEHKKKSLSLLVELHLMGYSANVKVSQGGKEAIEEMMKKRARHRLRREED